MCILKSIGDGIFTEKTACEEIRHPTVSYHSVNVKMLYWKSALIGKQRSKPKVLGVCSLQDEVVSRI